MNDTKRVTGTYTLQAQMPNGKTLSVVGYFEDGDDLAECNKKLDLSHDLLDRQRTKAEIPELEAKLDQRFVQLRQQKEHLEGLMKQRGDLLEAKETGAKMSSTRKKQLDDLQAPIDNLRKTLVALEEDIDKGQQAIHTAKKKLE